MTGNKGKVVFENSGEECIDLKNDIVDARTTIKPFVVRLLGLLQMWHMFQSTKVVADEFHSKYDSLSYQLRIACTRSFIVDYLNPWTGNYYALRCTVKRNCRHGDMFCPYSVSIRK